MMQKFPKNLRVAVLILAIGIAGVFAVYWVLNQPVGEQPPPQPSAPADVIAVVNGENISKSVWQRRVEVQRHFYTDISPWPEKLENLEQKELEFLVKLALINQFLKTHNRDVTDQELRAYIEESMSEHYPDFNDYLDVLTTSYQMTLDDVALNFKEELMLKELTGWNQTKRMVGIWLPRAKPSETGVADYDQDSHVIETKLQPEERPVFEKAQQILTRVRAGEDVSALAREFSQHEATRTRGGDLGFVSASYGLTAMTQQGPEGQGVTVVSPPPGQELFPATSLVWVAFKKLNLGESDLYAYQTGFAVFKVTDVRGEGGLIGDQSAEEWYSGFRGTANVQTFL